MSTGEKIALALILVMLIAAILVPFAIAVLEELRDRPSPEPSSFAGILVSVDPGVSKDQALIVDHEGRLLGVIVGLGDEPPPPFTGEHPDDFPQRVVAAPYDWARDRWEGGRRRV